MSAEERFGPMSGPFSNISQAYVGSLDGMARRFEPLAMGAARCNLELVALMTRRARAWLEVPARLSRCRTPPDLGSEQLRFWRTAAQDYADATRRLTVAFGALAVPGIDGKATARDYLTFPERTAAETARRDRRAA